jgi:hypothetical protein
MVENPEESPMVGIPNPQNDVQPPAAPLNSLGAEYGRLQALFDAQPVIVQRFLEGQARLIAEAYAQRAVHIRITLPDRITLPGRGTSLAIPEKTRHQSVGGFADRLAGRDIHVTLKQRLAQLDSSPDQALAASAGLLRFATAQHMIRNMLPAGRRVEYLAPKDEEIPSLPAPNLEAESAITATTDAIVEEGKGEAERGSLQVPYVPAARRFFLPQWVAFDDQGRILVGSVEEAEAHIKSMKQFLDLLFAARSLAPYLVADEEFEKKRYGMLGQLINQGRALAWYKTGTLIAAIKDRVAAQSLNRGLGLHMPYFDDQALQVELYNFVVIPAGRIMFVPGFVVRASQEEQAKVSQDTRLSPSTRKYLLKELARLAQAFEDND